MYSWIASFFNETENQNEENLYIQQQNGSQPKEEWTWIEVIEDREDNGLIIVQTDESTKNNNINGSSPHIVSKRKRRIQKSEAISRKAFKRSLYTDLPLMRKAGGKRFSRKLKLTTQVKNLYKKTTSEVLSTTFPTDSLLKINTGVEFDVSCLLDNTTFLKSLLEGILRHEVRLDGNLQQWLESLVQSVRSYHHHRINRKQHSIEWNKRQPLCIEWHKDPIKKYEIDSDELEIIEVRYPLRRWLQRIDVTEDAEQLPQHLKHINVSAFHNACGEHHSPDVYTVDEFTYVPRWMRRMDVCESYAVRDRHASIHTFPKWMQSIDVDQEDNGLTPLPSWMNRIDLTEDTKQDYTCYPRYEVKGSKSWIPTSCYSTDWVSVRPRSWIRPITSETSLVGNASSLCNSVINFAMVLATATCTAADDHCQKLESMKPSSLKEKSQCFEQKKKRRTPASVASRQSPKTGVKKNKKWLNKVNNVAKLQSKRIRYAAKSFSGRKCERAC